MAMDKKPTDNEAILKPKPTKKDNRIGSKTAPLETDFVIIYFYITKIRILKSKETKTIFLHIIISYIITQ